MLHDLVATLECRQSYHVVLGFESCVWVGLLSLFAEIKDQLSQLLRAPNSMGRRYLMRVDEGRNCWSHLAIRMKAHAVVGRGETSLLSGPGFELRLQGGREKEKKKRENISRDEQTRRRKKQFTPVVLCEVSFNPFETRVIRSQRRKPAIFFFT